MHHSEAIKSALEASDRMRADIFKRLDHDGNGFLFYFNIFLGSV
jgi:hypothetical protein